MGADLEPGASVVIVTDGVWFPGTVTEVTSAMVKLDSDKRPYSFEVAWSDITEVHVRQS